MTRHRLHLAAAILFGLVLAACNPAPEGGAPDCTSSQLRKPVNLSPSNGAIVEEATLSFEWSDPTDGCLPGGYDLQIMTEAKAQSVLAGEEEFAEGAGEWHLPPDTRWESGFGV